MPKTLFETIQHKNMASKCKNNKFKKKYFVLCTNFCSNWHLWEFSKHKIYLHFSFLLYNYCPKIKSYFL